MDEEVYLMVNVKKLSKVLILLVGSIFSLTSFSQVTNFQNSPNNYQNSSNNFENSPYNFKNSPNNFENSPNNYNSKNGVYDNQGNRTGYQVTTPSGVTNYFDNKGNRTGYVPSQR